jgi:Zn-dependent M28 family amino/carboxypeptidase
MTDDGDLNVLVADLRKHVGALSVEIGERSVARGGALARAGDYVHDALARVGLNVREQVYDFQGMRVANLIAEIPGEPRTNAYYVVGAHYDTVAGTPGADDNASAVAVLLELARIVAVRPPPVPVRLVAFTLEEPPAFNSDLQGSRVFTRRLAENESILGALILEMVGFTSPRQEYPFFLQWAGYPARGDFIAVVGNTASRDFGGAVVGGFKTNGRLPVESLFVPLNGWLLPMSRLSDHASFWDAGWPAVMVTDTAFMRNPNYHGPRDRMDTLDFPFMAQLVFSLERVLHGLARR